MAADPPRGRPRASLITLTTDFGLADPYVGTMKGVILGINPLARLVDITHGIAPQAIAQGMIALEAAWPYFPPGTLHVVVVDPGVGSARAPIAVQAGGHTFIGPDNGLFTPVLERFPDAGIRRIDAVAYRLPHVSRTFHGRDIFAPAAAWLSRGVPFAALGPIHPAPVRRGLPDAERIGEEWLGEVLYVDGFGNLVTNIPAAALAREAPVGTVTIAGRTIPVGRTYADVAPGALVAVVGSFERVEVAVNGGSARTVLEVGPGAQVTLARGRH